MSWEDYCAFAISPRCSLLKTVAFLPNFRPESGMIMRNLMLEASAGPPRGCSCFTAEYLKDILTLFFRKGKKSNSTASF